MVTCVSNTLVVHDGGRCGGAMARAHRNSGRRRRASRTRGWAASISGNSITGDRPEPDIQGSDLSMVLEQTSQSID